LGVFETAARHQSQRPQREGALEWARARGVGGTGGGFSFRPFSFE
jgi:hypothetical protein